MDSISHFMRWYSQEGSYGVFKVFFGYIGIQHVNGIKSCFKVISALCVLCPNIIILNVARES